MKVHVYDYKPHSRGRTARLVSIYEAAYQYRKVSKKRRGIAYTSKWKKGVYSLQKRRGWNSTEVCIFLDLILRRTMKEVRDYLLYHGSKIVRKGKKTRVPKKV